MTWNSLVLRSIERVLQMCYYIYEKYKTDLLGKHKVNLQDNPLAKV